MVEKQVHNCVRCCLEIKQAGLCPECLRVHDLKLKFAVGVIGILTLVSLYFYFVIYIEDRLGFLGL